MYVPKDSGGDFWLGIVRQGGQGSRAACPRPERKTADSARQVSPGRSASCRGRRVIGVWRKKISEEINQEERELLVGPVEIAASFGVSAETAFIEDLVPYEAIIRVCEAQQCQLIVIATRIRHGLPSYFIQSETQKLLAHTTIPVLVIR